MGLVYVLLSTWCARSLTRPRKVLDPMGAIIVRLVSVLYSFFPDILPIPTDWHWRQLLLDL